VIERVAVAGDARAFVSLIAKQLFSMCTDFELKVTFASLSSAGKALMRQYRDAQ